MKKKYCRNWKPIKKNINRAAVNKLSIVFKRQKVVAICWSAEILIAWAVLKYHKNKCDLHFDFGKLRTK